MDALRQIVDIVAGSPQELQHALNPVTGNIVDGNMGSFVQYHGRRPRQWWPCVSGIWFHKYESQPSRDRSELFD